MYKYGDDKMSFLDAVLITKTRGYEEEIDRHISPDIALAIKTIINGLNDEIKKAKENGYMEGYIAAEKEKDKIIEKLASKIDGSMPHESLCNTVINKDNFSEILKQNQFSKGKKKNYE